AVDNPAPAPDGSATLPVGAPQTGGEGAARPAEASAPPTAGADTPPPAGADTLSPPPAGADTLPPAGAGVARLGVGVGVLDTGIAANGDLAGRVVASADLSGEWGLTEPYRHGTFRAGV